VSAFKRGGVYHFEFLFEGQRHRGSTRLTNRTAVLRVEAMRKAALAEGRAGLVAPRAIPLFNKFVEEKFLPWEEKEHEAHPRTHQRYKVSSKPLIEFFGKMRLDAICPAEVESFKMERFDNISAAGTNRDLAALRFMLNLALRLGYIQRNPVSGVRFLKEGPGSMRIISHEEEEAYLAAANPLLRDIAILILETGMRPQELYEVEKANVHLEQGYLFVPRGKTKSARRNIPPTERAAEVLGRRMQASEGRYLFPHRSDPKRPMGALHHSHEKVFEQTGREYFRVYDLRHTYGSRAAMAGVDLPTLKELMGHSTISITMRYVHPTPEHKRRAVEKLEQFNAAQLIALAEKTQGSPQKSPQSTRVQ
jgi:integrase